MGTDVSCGFAMGGSLLRDVRRVVVVAVSTSIVMRHPQRVLEWQWFRRSTLVVDQAPVRAMSPTSRGGLAGSRRCGARAMRYGTLLIQSCSVASGAGSPIGACVGGACVGSGLLPTGR